MGNLRAVHFEQQATFDTMLAENAIPDNYLCFIKDTNKIYTHGEYYDGTSTLGDTIILNSYEDGESGVIISSDTISKAISKLQNQITNINTEFQEFQYFNSGHNTCADINAVPITKNVVICTISADGTLGLTGTLGDGLEVHIIILNSNTSNAITITIPDDMINVMGEDLVIESSSYGEINVLSDGTNYYVRGISI